MSAKNCHARQYGDQVCCGRCGLTWDANDPEPPTCREDKSTLTEQKQPGVDELAAQVEVMREALGELLRCAEGFEEKIAGEWGGCETIDELYASNDVDVSLINAKRALSITPSVALREVKARTLEQEFLSAWDDAKSNSVECSDGYDKKAFSHVQFWIQRRAAAIRKGG